MFVYPNSFAVHVYCVRRVWEKALRRRCQVNLPTEELMVERRVVLTCEAVARPCTVSVGNLRKRTRTNYGIDALDLATNGTLTALHRRSTSPGFPHSMRSHGLYYLLNHAPELFHRVGFGQLWHVVLGTEGQVLGAQGIPGEEDEPPG
jgi:hypothetical protein